MDVVGLWLDECCNVDPPLFTTARESFLSFSIWLKNNGFRPWNSTSFGRKIKLRFNRRRGRLGTGYDGFNLKDPFWPPEVDGLNV